MENKGCLWYLFIAWWWCPLKMIGKALLAEVVKMKEPPTTPTTPTASTAPAHTPAPTAPAPAPKPTPKTEHHNVVGTSLHHDALLSLGTPNEDYTKPKRALIEEGLIDERIYQTDFYANRVELVPEPDNPSDPNAIKVVVDGEHIGYIKKGSCAHVRKLLESDAIRSMRCEIKGGRYKVLREEEEVDEDGDGKTVYELITEEHPLCADLFITLKE